MDLTLRCRAYPSDAVASEARQHIDILRQIRNHAVRDYFTADYIEKPSEYDQHLIDWTPPTGEEPDYEYVLCSRNRFKQSVREVANEDEALRLCTLEEVVDILTSSPR